MKTNSNLLKSMLMAFESSKSTTTDITELKSQGFDYSDRNIHFHLQVLHDKGLIERQDGEDGVGYSEDSHGTGLWSAVRLRLTTDGHEFLETIRESEPN